ncbi:hypothetical protein ACHAW6_007111 [Cyclotella cf. meneghiniana]
MASSIPHHTRSSARGSGGLAARLQRIDDARQNQQRHSKLTSTAYVEHAETCHAANHQQCHYDDRRAAAVPAQETLSPSNSVNSSPRNLLQSRRQNMMQRRIEMRQRSEERQRKQQQIQHPNDRLPSCNNQNPLTRYETHQPQSHAHSQNQIQPRYQVKQQQSEAHQQSMNSILRGQSEPQYRDSSVHHQEHVSNQSHRYPLSYPIPSLKQQRPPSHSNPLTNVQYPHQNLYSGTQYQRQIFSHAKELQQSSPVVTSPPELDRKQRMPPTMRNAGEYPSANLFHGYTNNYPGKHQSEDDHEEGIEVEAPQFLRPSSSQENEYRLPSSRESPSDECLVEEGYYEDQYPQSQMKTGGSHEQEQLYEGTTHVLNPRHQQSKELSTQQKTRFGWHDSRRHNAVILETKEKKQNQPQPDWHQLNRNRLYQKKFAVRYQNAATNSSSKLQSQPLLQTKPPQNRNTSIANFSPIESLSTRKDQIQRKQRTPSHGESSQLVEKNDCLHNGQDQRHGMPDEGEESVASVLDRARSFEASYAGNNQHNVGGFRSRSVPRERTSQQLLSNFHKAHKESRVYDNDTGCRGNRRRPPSSLPSQESQTQYKDDDTVTESVASRKKEWEGKFQSGKQKKEKSPAENEAFSVWTERANRLAQQRKSEQRNEQRRSIEEKWRRSAVKSLPPERRYHERGSGVYGYDARYSQEAGYRGDEYQFVAHEHLGRDQHWIEQDSSLMSIEDRRRMLWDGKERLRAVLPKASSFESANRLPENTSPSTVGSSGSTFFKSKFVHAAAVARQQGANVEDDGNPTKRVISPKRHMQKAGAVSSHFTDSTAGTTPVGSNGSSHRTQSTSVSRMADQNRMPPSEYSNQMQSHHYIDNRLAQTQTDSCSQITEKTQQGVAQCHGNKISVMPSIAETPRSSVADLIARINAVSRSNPAEALAAIDSIIKAESGVSNSGKTRTFQQTQQTRSPFPLRQSETNTIQPCAENFQSKIEGVQHEISDNKDDDEEEESFLSSEDSTVSSMTNPTYLSVPAHSPPSMTQSTDHKAFKPHADAGSRETKKQPQYSTHLFDDFEVKTSKSAKKNAEAVTEVQSPQNRTHCTARQSSGAYSHRQNLMDDLAQEDAGKRDFVKPTVGGGNHRLAPLRPMSKLKSEDGLPSSNSKEEAIIAQQRNSDDIIDNAWVAVPENKYFQHAKNTYQRKPLDDKKIIRGDDKPSKDSSVHPQPKVESKYISPSELSQGQSIGLPSVVSDAFSGIDIDLDDGPVSNSFHHQPHATVSHAFSGVDIDLEPKKTVSQRRQELENLSRSRNQKSPGGEGDQQPHPESREKKISTKTTISKVHNNQDWATTPEDKKKAKVEPTLRLKGSKKLAQKFANLVKAFESDI